MKVFFLIVSVVLFLCCSGNSIKNSQLIIDANNSWDKYFNKNNITGTFVLKKINSDTVQVFNINRSEKHYLPASTFKILNSLISLETKAIENENIIIKWDGKNRFYDKWNKDQNMRTAIKYSCVWFYQELARRVGSEKMQYYLDTVNYGNSKLGDKIDNFWLDGDLRINAKEQIIFLEKFLTQKLPFSSTTVETVKSIMLIDSSDSYKYYAKTGWATRTEPQIGWYVGFVIRENGTWLFALNININKKDDKKQRVMITENILKSENIIE